MQSLTPVPGTLVWLRQRRWRVERARIDRSVVRLDVAHHDQRLTVLAPFDRPELIAPNRRAVTVRRQQARARLARLCGSTFGARCVRSAVAARIDLWPHQLEPALAVIEGQRRILIADEVGLGKTIQAGLILAELHERRPPLHALVVAPAGLCGQWTRELHDRFGLDVQSAERDLPLVAARAMPAGANPWLRPGIWIASIDYLKQRHVIDGLPPAAWDVVIVDEAHGAAGLSDRHAACDEIGRRARHFVLLSATPHTGDDPRFRRLVQMGALPFASDTLEVFRRTRADVALPHRRVVRWHHVRPSREAARLLDALQQFERVILYRTRPSQRDAALLLLSVFRKRALSTMHALDRSLARRLEWLDAADRAALADWLQPRLDFGDADDIDGDEQTALAVDLGVPVVHERAWLRRLRVLAAAALRRESKIDRLRALISRSREPVVVFTEFRHSLEHLHQAVLPLRRVAVLHGGQIDAVRRRELQRFLHGDASVLITTDVGGQGLNLQSRARWVVNLELPWNPARLEQRIGRVDRLGQTRRVHATLLVTTHAAEDALLASLARRTLTARRAVDEATLVDCAPPAHLAVASALFDRAPIDERPPVALAIPLSLRRRRSAHAVVRLTMRRRVLSAAWRSRIEVAGRPTRARGWLPVAPGTMATGVLVFSVLILDRVGAIVERHVVALAIAARANTGPTPAEIFGEAITSRDGREALEAQVTHRLIARLSRLHRLLSVEADRRIATERAIALHLHALRYPEEAQLGLFSRREATAFAHARLAAALADADTAARLRAEDDRARVDLARPVLEWIGERR